MTGRNENPGVAADAVVAPPESRAGEIPWRSISLLVLLAVWAIAAWLFDTKTLPAPWTVALAMHAHIVDGSLPFHAGVTFARSFVAFLFAMFLGTLLGILMGNSRRLNAILDTGLVIGLNLPALVVIILFYVWFGLNEFAAIAAVVVNKAPVVAAIVREGARSVDSGLLEVGRVFGLPARRVTFRIYLPQLYPQLAAAARSVFSLSWKIMLVVELLGRSNGIGFQMRRFFNYFDITSILAYSIAFIALVLLVELTVLQPLERHANRWRKVRP
ncbi:MAG: ABC transporter permease subunit [Proteobacteria bacterium]|nr:ABC transporter permease subunit [Pseudomonadota bacterium]